MRQLKGRDGSDTISLDGLNKLVAASLDLAQRLQADMQRR
jgi:hypothetical protein